MQYIFLYYYSLFNVQCCAPIHKSTFLVCKNYLAINPFLILILLLISKQPLKVILLTFVRHINPLIRVELLHALESRGSEQGLKQAAHQLIQSGPGGNFINWIGWMDGLIFPIDFFTFKKMLVVPTNNH